ncbi:unnamed protein product [Triticum turgidum subsp. durum]|uniref:Protein kinase domain-containing protein n=1 Tax=Triticum turgidum subsp. durum TaxID=4567 RepID=A0A9R1P6G1_TRITD|nr:unnamed protein product [Triticum turgidum subsp. durum]
MNYLRSRSLKRLLSIGRRSNPDEDCVVEAEPVAVAVAPSKPAWRCFSYEEVDQATNGFHPDNVVGRGGYGEVYCGIMADGRAVARHGVAVGTARGLRYLHKGCARRIIHRDIKASNILIDADYQPQISDFGLARWLPSEWTHHAIAPIEGTFGCLAPEYFTHGIVDEKTDVFAFGVFLLELISGRKPVDGSHMSLLAWAKPYLKDGVVQGLVDPRLGDGGYDAGQLRRLMFVASLCARAAAAWRPTMTEVLELLESDEISQERWQMPEEAVEDEFWDFDDLTDFEEDDDDDYDGESGDRYE